jgi:hypothetical protein
VGDKFAWGAEIVLTHCILCKHQSDEPAWVCAAFSGQIPAEIAANENDYRSPRLDPENGNRGDKGAAVAGSITFASSTTRQALETIHRYLDRIE